MYSKEIVMMGRPVHRLLSLRTLALALAALVCVSASLAQNLGKIAGTVKDKATGEPLVGANVSVKGTALGASTDVEGHFFILRVPPGIHDLAVTSVGYQGITFKGVRVQVDLTAEVHVKLEETAIEVEGVTVLAEQKMVQKDVTSTRRTVSQSTIRETPGLEAMTDIFKLQAGTIMTAAPPTLRLADGTQLQVRDESLQDVHIRGGRGGEILYMVDGMPVTHPIYGGRSVMNLNLVDVESVELLTGAFNAEYGQAQSGVVNIVTKSGGDSYKGGIEFKTDQAGIFGESYTTDYASFYIGGPEPITQTLLPALGIEPFTGLTFFLSGNTTLTNTEHDNKRTRRDFDVFGFSVRERQDNATSLNAKLNWDLSGEHKLALSYHGSRKQWSSFEHLWSKSPDNTADYRRNNYTLNATFNHVLSKATYYTLMVGYLDVKYNGSLGGKTPADFWQQDPTGAYHTLYSSPTINPSTGFYDPQGVETIWRDDDTKTYTFKGDLTSQVHPAHLIKVGLEASFNSISYIDIQDGGTKLSQYGQGIDSLPPPGPFPLFGQSRWVFDVKPIIASAYIQDKFELEYLVINGGVRIDYFNLGKGVMQQEWRSTWERATGLSADWNQSIFKISPRFGVSFPISENTVVFFSYGHFNQLPELQYYYRDPYGSAFTGNPGLDYEQTILYEFGFTHQLTDYWAVDIKNYGKDISKQIGTTRVFSSAGTPIDLYDNKGYGRTRGLEFEVVKNPSDFIAGRATYTIQWANGYSSSAFDDYIRSTNNFPYPIRERALEWDVRHQVIVQATLSAGKDQHPNVFGLELADDWNLTVLYRYSSGTPYTPGAATLNPVESQKQENTAYGPYTSSTDLKFEKGFTIGGIRFAVTFDVFNLFDQRNVQTVRRDLGFNQWTGEPYQYGDIEKPQNNLYDYYTMLSLRDPRVLSTGRTTKLGLRIDF
ncbi:MAG: TonB-dependent receptor [Bacteroidetes bacterium]|nr:TonB-dependent receptor [Bacteroidota bacterium]